MSGKSPDVSNRAFFIASSLMIALQRNGNILPFLEALHKSMEFEALFRYFSSWDELRGVLMHDADGKEKEMRLKDSREE